jgi:SAM-dependent methyltransferase
MADGPARRGAAEQFHRQAAEYVRSPAHFNAESLKMIGRLAREQRFSVAVDIATGPGFTAFEVSETAATVLATDPAVGMLRQARRLAAERGHSNVAVAALEAENMPFRDASIDLVTVRAAPHHFADVDRFLRESRRVLQPGGALILSDTPEAPESARAAAWMDDVERRRDPTHVRNLSFAEWRGAITRAGLKIDFEGSARVELSLRDWMERSGTPADEAQRLLDDWRTAPEYAVESFRIVRIPGEPEDYDFSWPVYVTRARP